MADGTRGKRWMRPGMMFRFSMAIRESDDGTPPTFVFHGPTTAMIKRVFNQLRGTMLKDYTYRMVRLPDMLNGCCPAHWEVEVVQPDFHLASPREWCTLIAKLLSRCVRCEVTIFKTYEQFLNN